MTSDRLFVDTNVLLASSVPARPGHQRATVIFVEAPSAGTVLFTSGQVLREYLAVATRPIAANGLGMAVSHAVSNTDHFASRMELLSENGAVADTLRRLLRLYGVRGKQVHDASIVATMLVHGIGDIMTADGTDFARFHDEIRVHRL